MKLTKHEAVLLVRSMTPEVPADAIEWGANLMGIIAPACSTSDGACAAWRKAVEATHRAPQAGVLRAALEEQKMPPKPSYDPDVQPLTGTVLPPVPDYPPGM